MKHCANDDCWDFVRFELRGEYAEWIDVCPRCSQRLSWGPAPQEIVAVVQGRGPWVEVASSRHEGEIAVLVSLFEADGLRYRIADRYGQVVEGASEQRLLVLGDDLERARDLLGLEWEKG